MTALYQTLPEFVPEPIGTGTYASAPGIHFFCCQLINMTDEIPEIQAFTSTLAELHKKGVSPGGRYGFHVPTYKGTIPQYTTWHDTWEESYYHSMKWFMHAEEKSQGVDEEMRELCQGVLDKVIPRLLRPLETGGRHIQPRLIHGDLWAGNTSWNIDTNMPVIYDAAALYAHNECKSAISDMGRETGKSGTGSWMLIMHSGNGCLATDTPPYWETIHDSVLRLLSGFCSRGRPR